MIPKHSRKKQKPLEDRPNSAELYESRRLKAIAARWDAKAEQWDRDLKDPSCHLNEDQAYQWFLDQVSIVIRQRAEFCASHGVIDAGCATGLVLAGVISSFAWGFGVDISPRMIQIALAKKIPGARFVVGDCFELPALCPKAGAVLSRGVLLSHYGSANSVILLESARASLVTGGFILWDFLNVHARLKSLHAPSNKAYFDSASVCQLALRAGFARAVTLGDSDRRAGLLLAEST